VIGHEPASIAKRSRHESLRTTLGNASSIISGPAGLARYPLGRPAGGPHEPTRTEHAVPTRRIDAATGGPVVMIRGWLGVGVTVLFVGAAMAEAGFAGIWWLVSARKWFTRPRRQGSIDELIELEAGRGAMEMKGE
jgi:hypothetical protein